MVRDGNRLDLVAVAYKALFAVADVGVALALENQFAPQFAGIPFFGDIVAAICAAVVASMIIVFGDLTGRAHAARTNFEHRSILSLVTAAKLGSPIIARVRFADSLSVKRISMQRPPQLGSPILSPS